MTTRVAFLRAVNVGNRTVKNARLVEIFEALGYKNVWTYINSGNVVFDAAGSRPALEKKIGAALEDEYGFEVTSFVRTAAEISKFLSATPFKVGAKDTYFATFLKDAPKAATAKELESFSNDMDTLVVTGRDIHWRMHGTSMETTLKKKHWNILGPNSSTSRNVNMLRKLDAKLKE
jgi:uncharacterized protein (DUF1697 family)